MTYNQTQEQDSDVMCEFCRKPLPVREVNMKVDAHLECWKIVTNMARIDSSRLSKGGYGK
jgi:hypothetical protein